MGARGNSGVILSQLFRGFAKSIAGLEQIDPIQFAAALQNGVDMAYKAVVKPVEGTILTVAKDTAKHATAYARRASDMVELMREIHEKANESLAADTGFASSAQTSRALSIPEARVLSVFMKAS